MVNEINNNKVNLCDSCSQVYPDCTSKPENVYFGDGIGHDNICACSEYQPEKRTEERTETHACDLIDRQAAIAFVDCGYLRPPTELAWSDKDVVDMLKRLPSAQPEQEIIACGDCKHYICHDRRCGYWNHGVKPLEWCCHAERKEDESN